MKVLPVSEQLPFLGDLGELLYELTTHTDREMAIIGGAYIERCLELAIAAQIKIFNSSFNTKRFHKEIAPLLSDKIEMAYHLGMLKYSDEIHGLKTIQGIRNRFAHYVKRIDCDSPEILSELDKINPSFFYKIERAKEEFTELEITETHKYYGEAALSNGIKIDLVNSMLILSKQEILLFSAPIFEEGSEMSNKEKLALCIHFACFSLVSRICHINFDVINEYL